MSLKFSSQSRSLIPNTIAKYLDMELEAPLSELFTYMETVPNKFRFGTLLHLKLEECLKERWPKPHQLKTRPTTKDCLAIFLCAYLTFCSIKETKDILKQFFDKKIKEANANANELKVLSPLMHNEKKLASYLETYKYLLEARRLQKNLPFPVKTRIPFSPISRSVTHAAEQIVTSHLGRLFGAMEEMAIKDYPKFCFDHEYFKECLDSKNTMDDILQAFLGIYIISLEKLCGEMAIKETSRLLRQHFRGRILMVKNTLKTMTEKSSSVPEKEKLLLAQEHLKACALVTYSRPLEQQSINTLKEDAELLREPEKAEFLACLQNPFILFESSDALEQALESASLAVSFKKKLKF